MEGQSESVIDDGKEGLEDAAPLSVLNQSEVEVASDLDKSGNENEQNNVIVLNSSSESEFVENKEESAGGGNAEPKCVVGSVGSESQKDSAEDDDCVPMDIDEELTEAVPEVKGPCSENQFLHEECSNVGEVSDAVEKLGAADQEEKEAPKSDAGDEEEPVLTPIGVRQDDEDMEQIDDGALAEGGEGTSAVIELFDDEEVEKDVENQDDLDIQPSPNDKMDIDANEEVAEDEEKHVMQGQANVIDVKEDPCPTEKLNDQDDLTLGQDMVECNSKASIDINRGISELITEKIKKVMDEEDSVFYGKECVNYECEQKCKNYYKAPLFALNFYKIPRKPNKNQYVCDDCYNKAVQKYEELSGALVDRQALLQQNIPKRQDFVEILDSSDEEEQKDTSENGGKNYNSENFYKQRCTFVNRLKRCTLRSVFSFSRFWVKRDFIVFNRLNIIQNVTTLCTERESLTL